jgi:hypothetical protein
MARASMTLVKANIIIDRQVPDAIIIKESFKAGPVRPGRRRAS